MAYTTIDDPESYFQTVLYTGNFTDNTAITLPGTNNMQPDLVWLKERDEAEGHRWHDAARGATKYVQSSSANSEATNADTLKSFDSDGFTLGANNEHNQDSMPYVAWCWKESATSGFDIVTWTGNETARTISHSLSAVPNVIFVKCRNVAHGWVVYHSANTSAPETDLLVLNGNDATTDSNTRWNDTAPTSSVFTVGTSTEVNQDTKLFVGYLFSEKQGFSKFGSYTGNGNADGAFVYLGFRPAWIMIKHPDANGYDWKLYDSKRDSYNGLDTNLEANTTDAEPGEANMQIDYLSNGFKIRNTNSNYNDSGYKYIYMAFAEAPFVNSNGVPCNAR